jgi:hypothetical protein
LGCLHHRRDWPIDKTGISSGGIERIGPFRDATFKNKKRKRGAPPNSKRQLVLMSFLNDKKTSGMVTVKEKEEITNKLCVCGAGDAIET